MHRILTSTAILTVTISAMLACSETGVKNTPVTAVLPNPNINVTPPSLEFGTLMSEEIEVQTFTIKSIGEAPLDVTDITIEGSTAFTILSQTAYTLDPEATVEIEVQFSPTEVDNIGFAVVHSDDPDEPETLVQLNGFGTVPELTITPDPYDFGTRFIPCSDEVTLTLENTGGDALTLENIGEVSDGDFVLTDNNALPMTLSPGESTTVVVTYTPTIEGNTSGELQVLSNDPRGLVTATQTGAAQYAAFTSDSHTVPTNPPVDILFAVDQSCSMDSISAPLANNFATFINQIDAATNGWKIGVTNIGTHGNPGGPAGCFVSGAIENTVPNYQGVFQNDVQAGSDSSGDASYSEYLMQLVDIALSKTAPGQCNSGFLRPGALLHIVMVTDEPDRSPEPWTYYLNNYEGFVSDPTLLKVSGLVANGSCGQLAAYGPITQATGGETINICAQNWANQLGNLGAASLNGVSNFELNNPADGASIQVTVNGQPRTDWTYDANANEVQFNAPLEGGDNVFIEYGVAVGCTAP